MSRSVPTLTDEKTGVTLRAHSDDDIAALVEQSTDPETVRWTRVPSPYSRDDAARFVREVMPGGWTSDQEWGFAVETEGRYAGTVTLRNHGDHRAEIAYAAHPAARGRGALTAGCRLLLGWAPEARDVRSVIWWAERGNWASRRLAWRLGFTFGGTVSAWEPHRDGLRDAWVGGLADLSDPTPSSPWLGVPRLCGRDVVLRRHRMEDADRVREAATDPRTRRWLAALPHPYTEAVADEFLSMREEPMAEGSGVNWMLADPDDDRLLGTISLMGIEDGTAEIGYWSHPEARGRGLMTQAVGLARSHAFASEASGGLGLRRLTIFVAAGNAASLHVAEAAGFTRTGIERQGIAVQGGHDDKVGFELLAGEVR